MEHGSLEIGPVLGATFALMHDRAGMVFGIALLVTIPIRLWAWAAPIFAVWLHLTTYAPSFVFGAVPAALVSAVGYIFGEAALAVAALARSEGGRPGFLRTLAPAARQLPRIVALALLSLLGIAAGMVLLIIPGVILSTMWSLLGPVAGAEQTGIMDSFRRSRALTDNLLWQIFLLFLVTGLGTAGFSWATERIGQAILGVGKFGLDYPFAPGAFLFDSGIEWIRTAFNLALPCMLYVILVERRGEGPMRRRLSEIFE